MDKSHQAPRDFGPSRAKRRGDDLRSLLASAQATEESLRRFQVHELLAPSFGENPFEDLVAEMGVTLEELCQYKRGDLAPPERREAVSRFLQRHFPEGLADPKGQERTLGDFGDTDTTFPTPPRGGSQDG
jgi:hypothetical protein